MQIAYNWLLDYLPKPVPVEDLSKILTSIGLEVEGVEKSEAVPGGLEGLVIGQVITCQPHPDADKLKVTTVNVGGSENLPIVCGAPNVAAGQKVVVATVGTTVHPTKGDAFKIKKAKIRGEVSEGMICAEDEIGLGESHDGIMILPEDAVIGMLAKDYFNIGASDFTLHIGLTPNRSDGNSHIGVARDVCAYQTHHLKEDWKVKYPETKHLAATDKLPVDIHITATEACPRYAGLTIANVKITASPEWLVQRLQTIGVRSINNVVDITNYVLHEYGQPLHAFDYDKISGHKINVRFAHQDEKFISLDDKERVLRSEDLMICDAEKGMCMAGVFGGTGSGITEQTRNIFLESAYFTPKVIRRTSMHHGLRTDAATHFEKGVDIEMVIPALKRAAALICEIAGGNIASDIQDIYPAALPVTAIKVQYDYINKLCGKEYKIADVNSILVSLGFEIIDQRNDFIEVKVPSDKPDVKQGADIVEEILRIDGLDNVVIPSRLNISLHRRPAPASRKWKEQIAAFLSNAGLQEIVTNSITNSKYYPEEMPMVRMINSLSSELDVMRPEMLESGLEVVSYNVNRKAQDLKLYEFGNIYRTSGVHKYNQSSKLSIWITGNKDGQHWQHAAEAADIYYLKGLVAQVFELCGIKKIQEQEVEDGIEWKRGKQFIAKAFSVDAKKLKSFDIKQPVFYAEIDVQSLTDAAEGVKVKYMELPKYPAMRRDLALILDKAVPYAKVAGIAQSQKWEALKNFELFDVFESEKIGNDKKSLALSFTFQLNDRTLTDEEVDGMMKQLISTYRNDLQALIRE
ncbi:phenylalanine--tRNA ligase subunit beta [Taibaiella lutea]|uniref:Phenylalanine--tRNA ligase beta subunit n=1 Tax=Taibaiella lutea TaxID=2608001 RepID=A0A5M6CMX1_9BACT|nr:phenylalanine--tRNA ligase subunit beta [Taibaiella lutea]KAA5536568.1 phenylalanine--tRNA ligase subunit beta [Taibaiella lutea]